MDKSLHGLVEITPRLRQNCAKNSDEISPEFIRRKLFPDGYGNSVAQFARDGGKLKRETNEYKEQQRAFDRK